MIQHVSVSTAALVAILAGAGGYALGQAMSSSPDKHEHALAEHAQVADDEPQSGQPGSGDMNENNLPPDHPAVGDMSGSNLPPGHANIQGMGGASDEPAAAESILTWTAPARWKSAPNPSSMRLATYVIPRALGDSADGDLSITQVGGDVDANVQRWLGQFDEGARASAKRESKMVHDFKVTTVEIYGTYSGGMGPNAGAQPSWGLLGAIVESAGMPYFFKITGPAKTVRAARAELDEMLATLAKKS